MLTTPVLIMVFNRPDTTRAVMDAIRLVRPARLYVAADGPRAGVAGEAARVSEARRIASDVDWPCEVHTLFRDVNRGARRAVTEALDWFFEHEPEGIILEDDCVPDTTFFAYCDELLARYRDDDRVMMISGNDYHSPGHARTWSYSFTRYTFIWGWATWRRAWAKNDPAMDDWPILRANGWLATISDGNGDFVRYWTKRFDDVTTGRVDSWAYVWTYSCWRADSLAIMPTTHLVTNVGFGADATHTTEDDWRANLSAAPIPFPLADPPRVERDSAVDRWADINVYYTTATPWRQRFRALPGARTGVRWLKRRLRVRR